MTATALILVNVIIVGGAALLTYFLTHGKKDKNNRKHLH